MKKNSGYFVLSFGLFLGWLLSFLYNGPALEIIFKNRTEIKYLAIAYILTPSILSFYAGFYNINKHNRLAFMKYAIVVNFLGTIALIYLSKYTNIYLVYIIAGIMGIFSVLFITGWGCYFVDLINMKSMYKYMGFAICVGYIIFNLNEVFKAQGAYLTVLISLFLCLLGSYYASYKIVNLKNDNVKNFTIALPIDLLVMMCFLMFLTNVGGGVMQTIIGPLAEQKFNLIHITDIGIYCVLGLWLYKTKKRFSTDIVLVISMVILASGYLILNIMPTNAIPSYVLIIFGYAILDIFIWSLVGEIGYIYGQPIKIFLFIMASNLLAVFMGNLFGGFITHIVSISYISIIVAALGTIFGFAFVPFINRIIKADLERIESMEASLKDHEAKLTIHDSLNLLTPKEADIYKLMIEGLKNKEIANRVNITENTLKGHARSIYKKFNVSNKKELLKKISEGIYQ